MIRVDPVSLAAGPAPAGAPPQARALIERQIAMLTRLAEIGMAVAEAAGREATAPPAGAARAFPDPALAYARAARAVRMTIALQSELLDAQAAEARAQSARTAARRARLGRLVERAVEAGQTDGDEAERLSREARERLTDADLDADLEGLSFAEVVARICRDLELSHDTTARIVAAAGEPPVPPAPSRLGADGGGAGPPRGARGSSRPRAPPH